jgi:hypothetical protein
MVEAPYCIGAPICQLRLLAPQNSVLEATIGCNHHPSLVQFDPHSSVYNYIYSIKRGLRYNVSLYVQVLTPVQAGRAILAAAPHYPDMLGITDLLQEDALVSAPKMENRKDGHDNKDRANDQKPLPLAWPSPTRSKVSRDQSPVLGLLSSQELPASQTPKSSSDNDSSRVLDLKPGRLQLPESGRRQPSIKNRLQEYYSSSDDKSSSHPSDEARPGGGFRRVQPEPQDLLLRRRSRKDLDMSLHDYPRAVHGMPLRCRTNLSEWSRAEELNNDVDQPCSPVWFFKPSRTTVYSPHIPSPFEWCALQLCFSFILNRNRYR